MRHELLTIENGVIIQYGNAIFNKLYLQIFQSDIISIILDSVAEKKCLINLFEGVYPLSSGEIFSFGASIPIEQSARFMRDNVSVISHTNTLISSLKIEENIFLFSNRDHIVLKKKFSKRFEELIRQFHLNDDFRNVSRPLSYKEKITIELLKAYVENKKVVVLSDLSGLIKKDLDELHFLIAQLKDIGMSFLIIEPVESMVSDWLSQICIIQHGRTVRMLDSKTADRQKIYAVLLKNDAYNQASSQSIESLHRNNNRLQFNNVYTEHIKDLNLTVKAGEVLRMLYLDDSSCDGIIRLLNGSDAIQSGRMLLNGRPVRIKSPCQAVKYGICFVNESPYNNMLFYNMSVRDNLALSLSHKRNGLWIKPGYMKSIDNYVFAILGEEIMHKKLRSLEPTVLQQIAYLKWILYAAKVVICVRPFNEVDIHLTEMTMKMIQELKNNGSAVLVLSSDIAALNNIRGPAVYFKSGRMISKEDYYRFFYHESDGPAST